MIFYHLPSSSMKQTIDGKIVIYEKIENGVGWYRCWLCEDWWSGALLRMAKNKQLCGRCFNRFGNKDKEWLDDNCEAYLRRLGEYDKTKGKKPLSYETVAAFFGVGEFGRLHSAWSLPLI